MMGKMRKGLASTATNGMRIAKSGTKVAINTSAKLAMTELPQSVNWLYGVGFKLGIYLILKTFLILRYQFANMAVGGIVVMLSQLWLAFTMISCGAVLQNRSMYENAKRVRKAANDYGIAALISSVVVAAKILFHWEYFKNPVPVNWFIDFFSGIGNGLAEFSLSVLFFDADLLIMFCVVLFLVARKYSKYADDGERTSQFVGIVRAARKRNNVEHDMPEN